MTTATITLIIIAIVISLLHKYYDNNDLLETINVFYILIAYPIIAVFSLWLSVASVNKYHTKIEIEKREVFIESFKNNPSNEYLQSDAIEWNEWLESEKYKNSNWFLDPAIPDEIKKLEPIKINKTKL